MLSSSVVKVGHCRTSDSRADNTALPGLHSGVRQWKFSKTADCTVVLTANCWLPDCWQWVHCTPASLTPCHPLTHPTVERETLWQIPQTQFPQSDCANSVTYPSGGGGRRQSGWSEAGWSSLFTILSSVIIFNVIGQTGGFFCLLYVSTSKSTISLHFLNVTTQSHHCTTLCMCQINQIKSN